MRLQHATPEGKAVERLCAAKSKRYRDTLRHACLDKYGRQCARCGIDDARVLQIDHIAGAGSIERRELRYRAKYYATILADATGKYQLLCANCNWIKRLESPNETSAYGVARALAKDK